MATRFDEKRLKRQMLGSNTKKFRRQRFQPQIKKVDGDVITLSNNIVEQKSGETSTPIFISPE